MSASLLKPKSQFQSELELRLAEGRVILEFGGKALTQQQFEQLEKNFRIWNTYNQEWLKRSFDSASNEYSKQYETSSTSLRKMTLVHYGHDPSSLQYRQTFFAQDVSDKIERLESLLSRLNLIPLVGREASAPVNPPASLAHLHPTVHQAAESLFTTNHYPQAIHAACTALEKAIQVKSGQSASITGTALLGRAFPKDNPLINLSDDQGEREGYGFLYRGLLQAVRNHYAHNDTPIDPARALEWLCFISALFYKLDEA